MFCLAATVGHSGLKAEAAEKPLPMATPESLGLSSAALGKIDAAVNDAIARDKLPGAVVVVTHRGKVIFRKAYGSRSLMPNKTAMTPEIVFDLASLTKPIATATSLMLLVEKGKIKLNDPLAVYLPAVRRKETDGITLERMLLHTSGYIADNPLADYVGGPEKAWQKLFALNPITAPGSKFTYSDVNYILIGKVIETVSGQSLDAFARDNVFAPLGMNETSFKPEGNLKERAAPTDKKAEAWIQGEVHDPRSYALGGVAGHAGLFSTADDLAVFCQMLMDGGAYDGRRILKAETVKLLTDQREIPVASGKTALRTFGWDMATAYSKNRGELFPVGKSFGHTGFTGTSIWIDPTSQTTVIFLSNRVHPNGKGDVTSLRSQVATIAAAAVAKR
jgi:CubicO group peptidase (beta-lactamase class C family)